MKRLLLNLSLLLTFIGLNGCANSPTIESPQIVNNVNVISNLKNGIGYQRYSFTHAGITKSTNFHVLGVFQDNNETLQKINHSLKDIESHYGSKEKAVKIKTSYKTKNYNEAWAYCEPRVRYGYYGSYRNLSEKNEVIDACAEQEMNKKIKIYSGATSYAQVSNYSKYDKKLRLMIKRGNNKTIEQEHYEIRLKKYNNRLFLYAIFPKKIIGNGSFKYAVKYIAKTLKNNNLQSIEKKTTINSNFFK